MRVLPILAVTLFLHTPAWAQASRVVRAAGEATLSVKPDQLQINIGVTTQGATAQEAAALNAARMDALLAKLTPALGAGGETRTINYSITPNYRYATGQPPELIGFTATNTVEAATPNLSLAGSIVDAASQAGATNISGLRFSLKDDEPVRAQALSAAARQARTHAESIAAGLGARLGAALSAQEGAAYAPLPLETRDLAAASPATPIESGFVHVRATVTVDFELIQ